MNNYTKREDRTYNTVIFCQLNCRALVIAMNNSTVLEDTFITSNRLLAVIRITYYTIYLMLFLISCIGNISVFVVSHRKREILGLQLYYCCSLAAADLTFSIFSLFYFAKEVVPEWIFGEFTCKLSFYVLNTSHAASVVNLLVLTFRKFKAVVNPLHGGFLNTFQQESEKRRVDCMDSRPYTILTAVVHVLCERKQLRKNCLYLERTCAQLFSATLL